MASFKPVLDEVNDVLNKLLFFNEILTSFIIFLACFLLLDFFVIEGVDQFYAIIPAVGYLVVALAMKLRKSKVFMVEKQYKHLDERLRTAEDNLSEDNEIVRNLHAEIIGKLKSVEVGSFFQSSKTLAKVSISVVLCFLIIFMNTFGIGGYFTPTQIDEIVEQIKKDSIKIENDYLFYRWPFALLALIIFLVEIGFRRWRETQQYG